MTARAERLDLEPLEDRLETHVVRPGIMPEAVDIQLSIAISLKRIADVLQGDEHSAGIKHALFDIAERYSM